MDKVRVRFAPSPTGYLHIGGLRTALYNWLFARKYKGRVILRIEDTDRKRFVPGATEKLIEILNWIGLDYDEGPYLKKFPISPPAPMLRRAGNFQFPNKSQIPNSKLTIGEKGGYGPYFQSKRLAIYQKYAKELVKKGVAYYCFCSPERLEKLRQEQIANKLPPKYDSHCRNLSQEEINDKLKKNPLFVIRLKFPQTSTTILNDLIRGKVAFDNSLQDDAVLLKSDGYPTYHLANVVDDYLMKITHIIRGEEWLSSIPKHLFLYRVFGWQPPKFAHLPLLLSKDRAKLSKRHGDIAVEDFRVKGYLPATLLNFSALLGWNPGKGEEQEVFTLGELVQNFSLEKIHKAGAIFDLEKLDWLNGWYIRKTKLSELAKMCLPHLIKSSLITPLISNFPACTDASAGRQFPISRKIPNSKFQITQTGEIVDFKWLTKVVTLEQERMKKLSEIAELTEFFFKEPNYERGLLGWKKMTEEQIVDNLQFLKKNLSQINKNNFNKEYLEKKIPELIKKNNLGIGETLWPMRVALSGRAASPGPFEIAEVLGKDKTLVRLNQAIKKFT